MTSLEIKPDVADEFVWLEPPGSPDALKWAEKETAASKEHLESQPDHDGLLTELEKLADDNAPRPSFCLAGDVIFMVDKTVINKQGVIKVAERRTDGSSLTWRVILDLAQLSKEEGKAWEFSCRFTDLGSFFLPHPRRLLVMLSDGGADVAELRELDVDTGKFIEDGFRLPECLIFASWLDLDHICIGHTLHDGPQSKSGLPINAHVWKRGTPIKEAKLAFSAPTSNSMVYNNSIRLGDSPLGCLTQFIDFSTINFHLLSLDGQATQIALPQKLRAFLTTFCGPFIVITLTNEEEIDGKTFAAGSVVSYDTSPETTQRVSLVYAPAADDCLTEVSKGGGTPPNSPAVTLTFKNRGSERYLTFHFEDGIWHVEQPRTAAPGTIHYTQSSDKFSNDTVVMESGLLKPAIISLKRPGHDAVELYSQPAAFDTNLYAVDLKVATSKDGTEVDYYFLRQKEAPKAEIPILMTAYGGFGVSYPTSYLNGLMGGISLVPWLKRGGGVVIVLVRGGSERGDDWHQQGKQEKRQNSYDDFIAVAETLIKKGLTTPRKLGAYGASNGGLLTAVMGTQRPDLFGAIVSDVPLTDMLRFTSLGMGALWTDEFGDPANSEDAEYLRGYSPYYNIKSGTKYPPFLVSTATDDDRAGVGHGRKFAAKMKEVGGTAWYLEDPQGGHYVSDPFKNVPLLAKRMTFFIGALV